MKYIESKSNQEQRTSKKSHTHEEPVLLGIKACLEAVFPDAEGRPSLRTFTQWRLDGLYPSVKIGRRIFLDPIAVRRALTKRFTINSL